MRGLTRLARTRAHHLRQLGSLSSTSSNLRALSTAALNIDQASQDQTYWTNLHRCLVPLALGLGSTYILTNEARCEVNKDVLIDTRIKIMNAWGQINEEIGQLEQLSPNEVHYVRPASPDISEKDGIIRVKFSLTPGVFVPGILQHLIGEMRAIKGENGEADVEFESTDYSTCQLISIQNSGLRVNLFNPYQNQQRAEIEFFLNSQAGLTDQAFKVIVSTMRQSTNSALGLGERSMPLVDPFLHDLSSDLFRQLRSFMSSDMFDGMEGHVDRAWSELSRHFFQGNDLIRERMDQIKPGELPPGEETQGVEHLHDLQAAKRDVQKKQEIDYGSPEANQAVKRLEKLGAIVYPPGDKKDVDWGLLAGYEEQKELIEETLLLALLHPEVYSNISSKTRKQKGENRPRAVLFEGPPGCGKTTSARVLASQASAPLVYIPVEAIFSKWYGESEKKLGDIFKQAEKFETCLIFLDEIDSLATSRGSEMHEVTRRILGVLLRHMDGFEGKKSIIIGATNRKQDLDPALRSRFDASVYFQLPDKACRQKILAQYAQQLSDKNLATLSEVCLGMSGRDLRDVCESAERRVASKIVKGSLKEGSLPSINDYIQAAEARDKQKQVRTDSDSIEPLHPWNVDA